MTPRLRYGLAAAGLLIVLFAPLDPRACAEKVGPGNQRWSEWISSSGNIEKLHGPAVALRLWHQFATRWALDPEQSAIAEREMRRLEKLSGKRRDYAAPPGQPELTPRPPPGPGPQPTRKEFQTWLGKARDIEQAQGPVQALKRWNLYVSRRALGRVQQQTAERELKRLEEMTGKQRDFAKGPQRTGYEPPKDPRDAEWNRFVVKVRQLEGAKGPAPALAAWQKYVGARGKQWPSDGLKMKYAASELSRLLVAERKQKLRAIQQQRQR